MTNNNDNGSCSNQPPENTTPSKKDYEKAKEVVNKYRRKRSLLEKTVTRNAASVLKFPDHRREIPCVKPFVESNFHPALHRTTKVPSIEANDVSKYLPFAIDIQKKQHVPVKEEFQGPVVEADVMSAPVVEENLNLVPVDIDLDVADPPVTADGQTNHSVVVRSLKPGDVGVMYNIHSNETFQAIYSNYAQRIDVLPREIRLMKWSDDLLILSTDKPQDVGIKSSDVIYVLGQPSVLNLNSRVKCFYITEVARDPITMKVSGSLDTRLVGLFHKWAERAGADPSKVVFMHERRYITTVDTIADAKLQNGDEVIAFVNLS